MESIEGKERPGGMLVPALIGVWGALVLVGSVVSADWSSRPGEYGSGAAAWPAATGIERAEERAHLLVFLHPLCPCSSATLRELERISARHAERLSTRAVFSIPKGAPAEWSDTPLVRQARAIDGVEVLLDADGVEARRFGARTSGAAFLFDREAALAFEGGITASRGHEGDNAGSEAILALLRGDSSAAPRARVTAPVFGCPLSDDEADDTAAGGTP